MKTKTAKTLPKMLWEITNGGVYLQLVRCGKRNCKCVSGEGHPAYYFISRKNGRQTKTYVPKCEAKKLMDLIDRAREMKKAERSRDQALKEIRARWRELRANMR